MLSLTANPDGRWTVQQIRTLIFLVVLPGAVARLLG
jgi:hypothetical protein